MEGPLGIQSRYIGAGSFPVADVEACIREALAIEQGNQQVLRPPTASACAPEIDSLVVVELICAIEELLGVTLPATFVPRGGYDEAETCIASLLAETRAVWTELTKQKEEHHA